MTSSDRVRLALRRQDPDRVPWDFWASDEILNGLERHLGLPDRESLLKALEVDLRVVRGPSYVGLELRRLEDGSVEDLWGVRRKEMRVERGGYVFTYKHLHVSPLAGAETPDDVARYDHWPSPDWWDYSGMAKECESCRPYAVVNAGDRLDRTAQLKTLMYLRGVEQSLVDLLLNPGIVQTMLERIRGYFLEYNRRVFESAQGNIDIFMMGDDFGNQNGLLMDVGTWRKHFKEGFRAFIDLAHRYNIPVMHHTCGAVRELIPEFIECGLDILQSLQPKARGMDLRELKREFGKDLCFHGGIDIQEVLPRGTPADVREHARQVLEAGKPGAGFIVSTAHALQPDVPLPNALALIDAYREFGGY